MTYDELEQYYGSGYQIAKKGGFSAGAPYNWKRQGFIPIETQIIIEERTSGILRANLEHCRRKDADKQ